MRLQILLVGTMGLAGCGYRSGSFAGPRGTFAGEHVTVGCLDLGVDRAQDAQAEGPVIAYEFGNRCDRAATVDLGALVVTGRHWLEERNDWLLTVPAMRILG